MYSRTYPNGNIMYGGNTAQGLDWFRQTPPWWSSQIRGYFIGWVL